MCAVIFFIYRLFQHNVQKQTVYHLSYTKHDTSFLNPGCCVLWWEVKYMLAQSKYTGKKSCIWNNVPWQSQSDIRVAPEIRQRENLVYT